MAACSDDGGPGAAAALRPVHPAGGGGRRAVRLPAALPHPLSQDHRAAGYTVLRRRHRRLLRLFAAPGGGAAPGLCDRGSPGRGGAVRLRFFRFASAAVGFLGRRTDGTGASGRPSGDVGGRLGKKNGPSGKKPLLFCAQMLYNKKNRVSGPIFKGRQQVWQKKRKRHKKSPAAH